MFKRKGICMSILIPQCLALQLKLTLIYRVSINMVHIFNSQKSLRHPYPIFCKMKVHKICYTLIQLFRAVVLIIFHPIKRGGHSMFRPIHVFCIEAIVSSWIKMSIKVRNIYCLLFLFWLPIKKILSLIVFFRFIISISL